MQLRLVRRHETFHPKRRAPIAAMRRPRISTQAWRRTAEPDRADFAGMRRGQPLHAVILALAFALPACPPAAAVTGGQGTSTSGGKGASGLRATSASASGGQDPARSRAQGASARSLGRPAVVKRGLETILQDDGLFLFRPAAEVEAAVAKAKALGIDTIRITAGWSSLTRGADQPAKPEGFDARDPGAYEQSRWRALDAAIRAIRAGGLKPLVDIGFWAPRWATTDPGPRARANVDPNAYADYAAAVALRYSGAFTPPPDPVAVPAPPAPDQTLIQSILQPFVPFPVPDPVETIPPVNVPPIPPPPPRTRAASITAAAQSAAAKLPAVGDFILWNEPNHQGLLMPQWEADRTTPASPRVYRAMLRAGYAAVKAVRKRARVLVGNTSSTGGTRGAGPVPPLEFLRSLACVDSRLKPLQSGDCASFTMLPGDGWAHHPYAQNERPSRVSKPPRERDDLRLADLPALATTLDILVKMGRIAPANRNIYLTEFGYETQPVPGRPTLNELQQARWLTWAEYLASKVPTVKSFAQFLLRDQPPAAERVSESRARPFGQYSTGLLVANGADKIAAKTFVAGLFAQKRSRGRVLLFGRLRLGAGRKTVTVQRRVPNGTWERIDTLRVAGRSSFTRTIAHVPGAQYRLGYPPPSGPRRNGIAIKPVPAAT